jgi:RNA polymerase sigma-70 factor, ECF subfamily
MIDTEFDFQHIFSTYQSKIQRYLDRLVGETEAEDLAQEVFVKVHQGLETFRGESSLSTWVYRIATNAALDRLRSPSFRRTVQGCGADCEAESGREEPVDQNFWTGEVIPLVEHQVFRKEMNECIFGYIQKLPEDSRIVLLLSDFEDLSNQAIADVTGVNLGTVKIRLHRARERLKEVLIANCDSYWIEGNEFLPELRTA